ncbi:MAG: hypothetical protein HY809_08950 [Nitrospirae bacterium]|nr:hypothetical protein [Nitrospirota bacterium]
MTAAQFIFFAGLYRFCNNAVAGGMSAAVAGSRGLIMLSMIELTLYLIALPIIFCLLIPAGDKTERSIWFTIIVTALLILPSVIPAGYLYSRQLPANVIITYLTTLFFIALFISAIAHLMNTLTADAFASIVTVYLILLSMTFGVILVNPIITWVTDTHITIQSVLMLNPYIAIASSINLDILRTDPLYYLSNISAYQFRYPAPFHYWLFYGIMSLCLFVIKMVLLRKKKQPAP